MKTNIFNGGRSQVAGCRIARHGARYRTYLAACVVAGDLQVTGLTMAQIARVFNVTLGELRKECDEYGLSRRPYHKKVLTAAAVILDAGPDAIACLAQALTPDKLLDLAAAAEASKLNGNGTARL
jgi:hypothetical protein